MTGDGSLVRVSDKKVSDNNSSGKQFSVKLKPKSSRSCMIGWKNDVLEVAVRSPPEKGKANEELLDVLKEHFGAKFVIVRGFSSREKVVRRV